MLHSPYSLAHLCGLSAFSSTASLPQDLIDVPVLAAEPEHDLGSIPEGRSEYLLAALLCPGQVYI
jgi:hypothetical protein